MDTTIRQTTLTFPVDPEHGALRSTVFVLFFVIWIVAYAVFNIIIPNDGINIIAGILGFAAAALLVSRGIEPFLRRSWPSGRVLRVDAEHIRLVRRDKVQKEVNTTEPVSVLLWNFKVKRRRNSVPPGWYVMACALEQDDDFLPVYALVSPEQAQALSKIARFVGLVSEKDVKTQHPRQDTLRATGEQRRLHLAEAHRWADGAELSPPDFEQFLTWLDTHFPQWMPLNR